MTEIFYVGLWEALFFHEKIGWSLVWGGGIVLGSGIYLSPSEYAKAKGVTCLHGVRTG